MALSVSVIGAGVMGLAAAWALSGRGHRVTVYDQGPVPNPLASSTDDHRAIRASYGAMHGYTRLAIEAQEAWAALWRETGTPLYHPTGIIALGAAGEAWPRDSAAALEAEGIEVRTLSPADLASTYPLLRPKGMQDVYYFDDGGMLFADRIVAALLARNAAQGVDIRPHSPIRAVDPGTAGIELADGNVIEADTVVIAAGPWTGRLLPGFADRITPSRQPVLYLEAPDDTMRQWAEMPMVAQIDPAGGFYAMPPVSGTRLKVGLHRFTLSGDPNEDRTLDDEEIAAVRDACAAHFANFEQYAIAEGIACFYTVEPDERFIVEPLSERCWVMAGFSGHGFKFATLLARELTEVLEGTRDAAALTARAAGRP